VPDVSIVIKGAGEMASGIAYRLFMADMTRVCMIDLEAPLCVRRTVSFCEAMFERQVEVEGVVGRLVRNRADLEDAWARKQIGVMVDPAWKIIGDLGPDVVVDAILAKRNLGTAKDQAPVVIGVGPGFSAPDAVHAAIESNRGPNLGRPIYAGAAETYTGIPAMKAGFSWERVLRAPHAGMVRHVKSIGTPVKVGETILFVGETPVKAATNGVLRGLIREIEVGGNEKVGDVDPGSGQSCLAISDKAMAIGNGVLEAIMHLLSSEVSAVEGRRMWSARVAGNHEARIGR
jgi:xanthine dehydrogenase accessory factor